MKINFNRLLTIFLIILVISIPIKAFSISESTVIKSDKTSVIDLARTMSSFQQRELDSSIKELEMRTGWKIRVLTQYENNPNLSIKDYWQIDKKTLIILVDPRGGNILNFNIGESYFELMPRLFWVELQTRFGNQYFVRENGEDISIISTINAVELCIEKGGCNSVPGLPREQSTWTLVSSLLGGLVAGFASSPKKENQIFSWGFLLLLSPLWGMLFGVFGIAPILTRTDEIIPLLRNSLAFSGFLIVGYLIAQSRFPPIPEENKKI
tara:strand:- start:1479 stop:2279 length:801 start_codon:yes stop_codon:yes gene_type:complete